MKRIYIFLTNMYRSIRRNLVLYIILHLVLIITFVALLHVYTVRQDRIREMQQQSLEYSTITVEIDSLNSEQVKRLYEEKKFQIDNIYFDYDLKEQKGFPKSPVGTNKLSSSYVFVEDETYYGEPFSKENIEKSEQVIIIPSVYSSEHKDAKVVPIDGKEYKIVGESQEENIYQIPYTTMLRLFPINKIQISLNKDAPKECYIKVKDYIEEEWECPKENIELPEVDEATLDRQERSREELIQTAFFAFLNCSFIYAYTLQKRKREFAIMRIVGCTRKRAFVSFVLEEILFGTVCFCIGSLLYIMANQLIFPHVLGNIKVSLYLHNFIELYVMSILVMLVIISILTVCFVRQMPRKQLVEGEEY